jgi:hypothetical protein
MKTISYLSLLFFLGLNPLVCWAHFPVFLKADPTPQNPYTLNRPYQKSIAIYTQFESDKDVDVYRFHLKEEDLKTGSVEILIGTLVPSCRPLKDLLIAWSLIGPKQESLSQKLDKDIVQNVRFQDNLGALTVKNTVQGKIWYEPYTAHYYFYQQRKKIILRLPGEYRIYIFPLNDKKGDYVFEFGAEEIWSLKDILYTLWVYPKLLFEAEISTDDCTTTDSP